VYTRYTVYYSCCWAAQDISVDMVGPDIQIELLPWVFSEVKTVVGWILGPARETEAWMDPVLLSGSKDMVRLLEWIRGQPLLSRF
jgi:hypothetical protein